MNRPLDELANRALWVTWRIEQRMTSAGARWTKVPYAVDGGRAKADNPSTWMTRAQAEKCAKERSHAGIGLMFGCVGDKYLGGIDLDACFAEAGDLLPWAKAILDLVPSYVEMSPSGKGLKLFFYHDGATTLRERWRKHVQKPNPAGGKDIGVELYLDRRWFAFTGDVYLDRHTINEVSIETLRKVEKIMLRFDASKRGDQQRITEAIEAMSNADLSWEDWNTRGMAIYAASGGSAWGYAAFRCWSQKSAKYDEGACEERWNNWRRSPPTQLTAGTIFHFAKIEGGYSQCKANGHARDEPPLPKSEADYVKRPAQADCSPQSLRDNGSNVAAVMDILRNYPTWRGVLAFDRFSLRVMLMKPMPRTGPQPPPAHWVPKIMRDVDCTNALAWFHELGMTKLTINMLYNAMAAVAQDNAFHPVLDYFDRVCSTPEPAMPVSANDHMIAPYLGRTEALSLWLTLGFGAADNELNRAIARAFMIAVVRRVRQPGCQQDYMPVLIGGQGDMKSTGARILFGDAWFADRLPAINTKDALIQLHGKLVIERPEVENLGNADKAFLSSSSDRFRAPYGRIAEDYPRTCNFVGTTNFPTFIKDASGGRRYWPIFIVTAGDRDWLAAARDLIWRQACIAEAKGDTAWLNTKELQRLVRLRQDAAQQPDPWDDKIVEEAQRRAATWEMNPNTTTGVRVNADFITAAVDLPKDRQNNGHLQRATDALMKADWRRGTGRRRKLWFPPDFHNSLPFDEEDDDG